MHIMAASTARTAAALFRAVVAGKIGINVLVVAERESLKGGKIRGLSKAGLTFATELSESDAEAAAKAEAPILATAGSTRHDGVPSPCKVV